MRSYVTFCRLCGLYSILLGPLTSVSTLSFKEEMQAASIIDFPYFASIEVNGQYTCSATIVDDKYVMTAYSCVQGFDVKSLGVRVGTSRQGQRGAYYKVISVSAWKDSPYIGPAPQVDYDIAMVKVAVSFWYTPQVLWANPNADGIHEYQEGSLVGWADVKDRGSQLSSANFYVMPSKNCSQIYSSLLNISTNMYCLQPSDAKNTKFCADMGAPFYLNEQYYGLVTHAPRCDSGLPVVVTGVAKFTGFIIMVLCDMGDIFGNSLSNRFIEFIANDS